MDHIVFILKYDQESKFKFANVKSLIYFYFDYNSFPYMHLYSEDWEEVKHHGMSGFEYSDILHRVNVWLIY